MTIGTVGSDQSGATAVAGTTQTATYPTGITAGNLLLLCVVTNSTTTHATTPSGWTAIKLALNANGCANDLFAKIADGTETGTLSVTTPNKAGSWYMAARSGQFESVDCVQQATSAGTNTASTIAAPLLAGVPTNAIQMSFAAGAPLENNTSGNTSVSAGWSELAVADATTGAIATCLIVAKSTTNASPTQCTSTFASAATASAAISCFITETGVGKVGVDITGASTSPLVIAYPSGIASGDMIIVAVACNNSGTVTTPSGYTLMDTNTENTAVLRLYAKIAAGTESGTNLSVTFATSLNTVGSISVRRAANGFDTTLANNFSSFQHDVTTGTVLSKTTTALTSVKVGSWLMGYGLGIRGTNSAATMTVTGTNWVKNVSGSSIITGSCTNLCVADDGADSGTANAATFTFSNNQTDIAVTTFALSGLAPLVLVGGTGTFTETGNAAKLLYIREMAGATGAFTWNVTSGIPKAVDALLWNHKLVGGVDAIVETGGVAQATITMRGDTGAFVETGAAATFIYNHKLVGGTGAFVETGGVAQATITMRGDAGSFVETGSAAELFKSAFSLVGGTGVFAETGDAAALLWNHELTGGTGAFVETGDAASLTDHDLLVGAAGTFIETGDVAALVERHLLVGGTGTFVETGDAAELFKAGITLAGGTGAFVETGSAASLTDHDLLVAGGGSFVETGGVSQAIHFKFLTAGIGIFILTGDAAELFVVLSSVAFGRTQLFVTAPDTRVYTFSALEEHYATDPLERTYVSTGTDDLAATTSEAAMYVTRKPTDIYTLQ